MCAPQSRLTSQTEAMALQSVRSLRGNSRCADCEAQSECRQQQHYALESDFSVSRAAGDTPLNVNASRSARAKLVRLYISELKHVHACRITWAELIMLFISVA